MKLMQLLHACKQWSPPCMSPLGKKKPSRRGRWCERLATQVVTQELLDARPWRMHPNMLSCTAIMQKAASRRAVLRAHRIGPIVGCSSVPSEMPSCQPLQLHEFSLANDKVREHGNSCGRHRTVRLGVTDAPLRHQRPNRHVRVQIYPSSLRNLIVQRLIHRRISNSRLMLPS